MGNFQNETTLSDYKELTKCDIQFSINLENISEQFSLSTLKSLKHQQEKKIGKNVTFFVPHQFRTSKDAETSDKMATLRTDLEDWVEDYFGFLLASGYVDKVVQHGISQIFWVCPFYSIDSLEFKILCCFSIVGAILNDWVDSSKTRNADCEVYKSRMEVVEHITNLLGTGIEESQVKTSKSSMLEIMNKAPIVSALYDGLLDIYEMTKQVQPDLSRKTCFGAFRLIAMGCFQGFQCSQDKNGGTPEGVSDYSVETCRYFQQSESPLEGYCAMMGLLEGYELPLEVKTHAVFFKWNDLAAKISVIQNDILSFPKNVENGKDGGILIKKIEKGLSVDAAIDEELKILSEITSDYVKLRRILVMRFKENTNAQRYIDIVDSWLYGNIQAFIGSHNLSMKNDISIIHQ